MRILQIEVFLRALGLDEKGSLNYEEFLSSFREEKEGFSIEDVDASILSMANACDAVLVLLDPVKVSRP